MAKLHGKDILIAIVTRNYQNYSKKKKFQKNPEESCSKDSKVEIKYLKKYSILKSTVEVLKCLRMQRNERERGFSDLQ